MKIYRFAPDLIGYSHPRRGVSGRWWPSAINLGRWMEYAHGDSWRGLEPQVDPPYGRELDTLPFSDFPWLSLQLPVMSMRAAERLGAGWPQLAERLRAITIGGHRFFAVQPLLAIRGEPHAFIPEASVGIALAGGQIAHYHTRVFEPSRVQGEWFTIPDHEPYSETYVTGSFVERVRDAGLTGLDHLELVYDDRPIAPRYPPRSLTDLERPSYRQREEWDLFRNRGYVYSYEEDDLRAVFDRAVLDGLMPIHDP